MASTLKKSAEGWGGAVRRRAPSILLLALLAGAVLVPASAAEPEPAQPPGQEPPTGTQPQPPAGEKPAEPVDQEKSRFFVGVEVWGADLKGFDLTMAESYTVTGCDDASGDGFCQLAELQRSGRQAVGVEGLDMEPSLRIQVGWRFPGGNRIGARYWRHEPSGDTVSADSSFSWTHSNPSPPPADHEDILGGILPILGSSALITDEFGHLPHHVEGEAEAKAASLDVLWTREHPLRGGWDMEWTAGLRWLAFEADARILYQTDTPDRQFWNPDPLKETRVEEEVRFSSKTDGIGPIVGGRLGCRFGKNRAFGVHGRIEVAGVLAGTDWEFVGHRTKMDLPFAPPGDTIEDDPTNLRDERSDRTVFTLEAEVGLSYKFRRFRLEGGWRTARWEDAWTRVSVLDPEDPTQDAFHSDPMEATFSGVYLGASWGF